MPILAEDKIKPRRKFCLLGLFVLILLFAQVLFGTAPKFAIYFLAENFAGSLLSESSKSDALPRRASKRLFGLWMEQNILSNVYNAQTVNAKDDAQRIGLRLVGLRSALLSQLELPHDAPEVPVEIAGFGWCEGVNGVAAILLSHEFDNAQLVSLKGPSLTNGDGHAFGRVWSRQANDWLYFDIWSGEVVVFRHKRGDKARYLFRQVPKALLHPDAPHLKTLEWFHDRAALAIKQNELQPTVGSYLWNRTWHYLDHGFTAPETARGLLPVSITTTNAATLGTAPLKTAPLESQHYVRARLDHLFGDYRSARNHYRVVANTANNSSNVFGRAATMFVSRLSATNDLQKP